MNIGRSITCLDYVQSCQNTILSPHSAVSSGICAVEISLQGCQNSILSLHSAVSSGICAVEISF